jgi:beta-lactam-binding protein with PASTA domain
LRVSFRETPPRIRVFAVLLTIFCATASPALAYDGDTHYAWTYYLAIHVGYSPRQAYQLASAAWAIDHDAQTGPLHASAADSVSGAPNPAIERVWRRFHAFADAVYVGAQPDVNTVGERRREGEETLAAIGARQRNIGAQIHYAQDYFAHNEYDSVRGHAVWGHAPDRIGHGPNRARAMTRKTLELLTAFAPVVGVQPRAPDEKRLWEVLDRLIQVNPPLFQIAPANYDLVLDAVGDLDLNIVRGVTQGLIRDQLSDESSKALLDAISVPLTIKRTLGINKIAWGDVNLGAAVDVVNAALIEDAEVARVRRFPPGWTLPKQWIQYDFDADGEATAEAMARQHFSVDAPQVTFGEAKVSFRRDPSSASLYEVTVQQPYAIEGMATLPAFRAIPLVERSVWSDDTEQLQLDRDRTNGAYVMERKVFRPRAALLDGSLKWKPAVDLYGDQTFPAPEVAIRLRDDFRWYVVRLSGTGYDLRSAGVNTGAGGGSGDTRGGLHRRRGNADLVVVKLESGASPAAAVAEIRKTVAEPHCRRASSIAPSETVEPPGASLAGLPQYWDDVSLEAVGPFASLDAASAAMKRSQWEALDVVESPNLADIEFRSGCSSPIALPVLVSVPAVAGLRADEAEARLRAAGLTAYLVAGAAPASREEQYTIEKQEPAASTRVEKGSRVRVAVRPAFVEPGRAVPAVTGLTAAAAQQRLEASGFVARVAGGDPAPSADRAFTVQDQQPEAGTSAPPGSSVTVRIFSKPDTERVVPNLIGLTAAEADRRLRENGLVSMPQGGDPAPTSNTAFTVQSQQPPAGTTLESGARVQVRIHSAFVPDAQPADPPVRGGAGEEAVLPPGADPNFFRCPSFGNRSFAPTRLSPQSRWARCPPGGWDFYPHAKGRFELLAQWSTGPRPAAWDGTCGGPPVFKSNPGSIQQVQTKNPDTGEMTTISIPIAAATTTTFPSAQRMANVAVTWRAFSGEPMPPLLMDIARQLMVETEWRAVRCDGTGPTPPAATPPPPPNPVRQAQPSPQPQPAAPADTRPPCTCTDASGRGYRMLFGQECDPAGSGRDNNCRP